MEMVAGIEKILSCSNKDFELNLFLLQKSIIGNTLSPLSKLKKHSITHYNTQEKMI